MRTFSKIATGAAVVLLLAAMVQPAEAACATARSLETFGAYLVSNPNWGGAGGTRTCLYGYGCYQNDPDGGAQSPPISADIDGIFWGFDTSTLQSQSDPAIGFGMDTGGWGVENWTKQRTADFGQPYYYPAWMTEDQGVNGTPGNATNWSQPVDGCPNDIDPNACTCLLLTDQWDGVGYFLMDSSNSDAIGNFIFEGYPNDPGGAATATLAPIPAPAVTMSARDEVTADVTLMVDGGSLAAADFRDAGCDCGVGYIVYQMIVGRGGMAPTDRSISRGGWMPAMSATGGNQTPTAFGQTATVVVDCDPALQQDLYIATSIVDSNGYATDIVSANSLRIECGAQLAEPNRPDRDRGRSADAPRGRDNNRGQRDR
jgi:hypothetical protein